MVIRNGGRYMMVYVLAFAAGLVPLSAAWAYAQVHVLGQSAAAKRDPVSLGLALWAVGCVDIVALVSCAVATFVGLEMLGPIRAPGRLWILLCIAGLGFEIGLIILSLIDYYIAQRGYHSMWSCLGLTLYVVVVPSVLSWLAIRRLSDGPT